VAARLRALVPEHREPLRDLLRAIEEFTREETEVALELIDDTLGGGTHYRFVVAEDNDGVAGYVCYGPAPMTDGVWDLYWIVVAPRRRRAGLGSALLAAAETAITSEQGRMILIETASQVAYESTRRFYQRAGYGEAARVADYYRIGDDKVIYGKPLG